MDEIWLDIQNYEGRYQVSNLGRVKSLQRTVPHAGSKTRTFKETILKTNKVAFDYLQVTLYKDGKRKCRYVHNLVMEAFVGEKKKGYEVNHKDENKNNNTLENLEYLTAKENNNYGTRKQRASQKMINGKKSKKVKGTHLITGEVLYFPSISEAGRQGFNSHISEVCRGKRKHAHGYKWEFVN